MATRTQLQTQLAVHAKTLKNLPPNDPRAALIKQQMVKIKAILDADARKKAPTKTVKGDVVVNAVSAGTSSADKAGEILRLQSAVKAMQDRIAREKNPVEKIRLTRLLAALVKGLQQLTLQSKVTHLSESGKTLPAGYVRLSKADALARKKAVVAQIKAHQEAIKRLKASLIKSQGGGESAQVMEQRLRGLLGQYSLLQKRYAALQQGVDIPSPKVVSGGRPRKALILPRQYTIPDRAIIAMLISMLAARLPPRSGESRLHYLARLRAYVKRALARFVIHRHSEGLDEGSAADASLNEALIEDGPAIESEVDAGGIAQDSAADAMDAYLASYDTEFQNAMEQANPEASANMDQAEFSSDGDYSASLSSDAATAAEPEFTEGLMSESGDALDAEIAAILAEEPAPSELSFAAKAGLAVGGIILALAALSG